MKQQFKYKHYRIAQTDQEFFIQEQGAADGWGRWYRFDNESFKTAEEAKERALSIGIPETKLESAMGIYVKV